MFLSRYLGERTCVTRRFAQAPCALSNSLSSYGQYEALKYVSFPLQTISKSTKVIPVMLMGKVLNKKQYPRIDYLEALMISTGVILFSLANRKVKVEAVVDESDDVANAMASLSVSQLAGGYTIEEIRHVWCSRVCGDWVYEALECVCVRRSVFWRAILLTRRRVRWKSLVSPNRLLEETYTVDTSRFTKRESIPCVWGAGGLLRCGAARALHRL